MVRRRRGRKLCAGVEGGDLLKGASHGRVGGRG